MILLSPEHVEKEIESCQGGIYQIHKRLDSQPKNVSHCSLRIRQNYFSCNSVGYTETPSADHDSCRTDGGDRTCNGFVGILHAKKPLLVNVLSCFQCINHSLNSLLILIIGRERQSLIGKFQAFAILTIC